MLTDHAALRAREFPSLGDTIYLDYTGAALAPASVVDAHHRILRSSVLGNPHSEHSASRASTEIIDRARARLLRFLDADPAEYVVVFTANATAAVKIVAESFPFDGGELLLSADNHNSVNGIAEYARRAGARIASAGLDSDLRLRPDRSEGPEVRCRRLFAYPAQSNFSGVRHSLGLARSECRVLLDAASYLGSHRLSLRASPADFVVLSMYKIVGYPTGVGALVAKRDALAELSRPWFAGGTVDWAAPSIGRHRLRDGADAFEDGTPNFLSIAAVEAALDFIDDVGMENIETHAAELTAILLDELQSRRHRNGRPMFTVYGPTGAIDRGGTVAFNAVDSTGRVIAYEALERAAAGAGVMLRGGCFCNPGASQAAFGLDPAPLAACFDRLASDRFTPSRLRACLAGKAVGALRASVGIATSEVDVRRAVEVVSSFVREDVALSA